VIAAPAAESRLSRGFWPDFGFVWPRRRRGLVRQAHHLGFVPIPTGLGFVRPAASTAVANASTSNWPAPLMSRIVSITSPAPAGAAVMQSGTAIGAAVMKRWTLIMTLSTVASVRDPSQKAALGDRIIILRR
jgi:hypothetical protein